MVTILDVTLVLITVLDVLLDFILEVVLNDVHVYIVVLLWSIKNVDLTLLQVNVEFQQVEG